MFSKLSTITLGLAALAAAIPSTLQPRSMSGKYKLTTMWRESLNDKETPYYVTTTQYQNNVTLTIAPTDSDAALKFSAYNNPGIIAQYVNFTLPDGSQWNLQANAPDYGTGFNPIIGVPVGSGATNNFLLSDDKSTLIVGATKSIGEEGDTRAFICGHVLAFASTDSEGNPPQGCDASTVTLKTEAV